MTSKDMADLILGGWAFVALFSWAWMLFMAVLTPIVMISAMRSLRRIARRLEDGDSGRAPAPAPQAAAREAEHTLPDAPSMGHQLLR